jgi:hypothetical protein
LPKESRHITTELLSLARWIVILFECDRSVLGYGLAVGCGLVVGYGFGVDYGLVVDYAALIHPTGLIFRRR